MKVKYFEDTDTLYMNQPARLYVMTATIPVAGGDQDSKHCDNVVSISWNFKHIVHFEKIPKYNAVNALKGYRAIGIFSPSQVIDYGDS